MNESSERKIEEIKYSDIEKANKEIRYMTMKRKDKKNNKIISKKYAEVHERVKAFRKVYPNAPITTEIEEITDKSVRMLTTIKDKYGNIIATARASETKDGLINATSMIENCETSAVGRALGFCGFGVDTAIASAEEIQSSEQKKSPTENMPIGEAQKQRIIDSCTNEEIKRFIIQFGKKNLSSISFDEAEQILDYADKKLTREMKEKEDVF